jgi:hypothetical protein
MTGVEFKMFLALVEIALCLEELSTGKFKPGLVTYNNYRKSVSAIESASGLPWSEVKKIYEE